MKKPPRHRNPNARESRGGRRCRLVPPAGAQLAKAMEIRAGNRIPTPMAKGPSGERGRRRFHERQQRRMAQAIRRRRWEKSRSTPPAVVLRPDLDRLQRLFPLCPRRLLVWHAHCNRRRAA